MCWIDWSRTVWRRVHQRFWQVSSRWNFLVMLLGVVFCAQMSQRLKRFFKSLLLPTRNRCVHCWVCWVFTDVTFLALLQWLLLSLTWQRKVVARAAPFIGLQIAPVRCRRSKISWAANQFCYCLDWISHLCFRLMPVRPVWEQFCFKSLRIVYILCALPVASFWIGRNGTAPLSVSVSQSFGQCTNLSDSCGGSGLFSRLIIGLSLTWGPLTSRIPGSWDGLSPFRNSVLRFCQSPVRRMCSLTFCLALQLIRWFRDLSFGSLS